MAKGLLIWLAGGAGTFLLYSAVSNQTPLSLLQSYLGSGTPSKFASAADQYPAGTYTDTNGDKEIPVNPNDPNGAKGGPQKYFDPKSGKITTLSGYDGGGVYDLIDANGNNLGAIPGAYQSAPNAFVPPPGGKVVLNA